MRASTPPKKRLCGDGNNGDKTLSVRRLGALLPRAPVRVLPFPFAVGVAAPLPAASRRVLRSTRLGEPSAFQMHVARRWRDKHPPRRVAGTAAMRESVLHVRNTDVVVRFAQLLLVHALLLRRAQKSLVFALSARTRVVKLTRSYRPLVTLAGVARALRGRTVVAQLPRSLLARAPSPV